MFLSAPCHEILALWEWCGWARHRPRQVGKHPWQQCQGSWGKQLPETVAGSSPATRSSQGEGNADALICHWVWNSQEEMAKKQEKEWGEKTLKISWDLVGDSPTASPTLIHGKNPNTTFPAPSLLAHTTLLWGWTYIVSKINSENHLLLKNVHMRQDKKLSATHSQPEDTGSTAQHLQPGAVDGLH